MTDTYSDGSYLRQNPTWHEEDSGWKAAEILKMIERNKLDLSFVGDVGCGSGQVLVELAKTLGNSIEYYGFETSPDAFLICKRKETINIKYLHEDIIPNDIFFDLLLVIDVFEHTENYLGFLKALRKKGHYKIFHIPLDISVQSVLRTTPISRARNVVGHLHYFSKETAIETLRYCGYQIIDHFYTPGSHLSPNKTISTKVLNMPRKLLFLLSKDWTVRLLGGYSLLLLAE
jgi:SAM-dependent methyltransferase